MRLARIVLLALFGAAAVVVGLFVAALLALVGLVARLLGGKGRQPRAQVPAAERGGAAADVIDVTATEVREEKLTK